MHLFGEGKILQRIAVLFFFLIFFLPALSFGREFYLSYTYPGSLGYFSLKPSEKKAEVIVKTEKGKILKFKGFYPKVFFAIPYDSGKSVDVYLKVNGKTLCRKRIIVAKKRFRISRIWVKERKITKKILERIKRERKILTKILSTVSPKIYRETFMRKPLRKLVITTPFGAKRIINGKKRSIHWGTDFKAPKGEPVFAVLSGKVAYAGSMFFTGNTVIIDHGLGIHTLYAHLSKINVKKGEFVKAGKVIGRVGSTGRSTGPHLHFGVYVGTERVDPMIALKSRF
jgi:murein DD-endopeptidase MepM/ murein hydrolase activator NlpD